MSGRRDFPAFRDQKILDRRSGPPVLHGLHGLGSATLGVASGGAGRHTTERTPGRPPHHGSKLIAVSHFAGSDHLD
jgi:hypothetical protein